MQGTLIKEFMYPVHFKNSPMTKFINQHFARETPAGGGAKPLAVGQMRSIASVGLHAITRLLNQLRHLRGDPLSHTACHASGST